MHEASNILLQHRVIEAGRPALFLDRDGVINVDTGYVSDPSKVVLLDGAAEMIKAFNKAGWPVIVVSNQSGIGRGYFSRATAIAVQDQIDALLERAGCWLDAVFLCAASPSSASDLAAWRKPSPGMLLTAAHLFGVSLRSSFIVGDKKTDMQAGALAHLQGGFWLTPEQPADIMIDNFPVIWTPDHRQIRPAQLSNFGYEAP